MQDIVIHISNCLDNHFVS